jgi:hypothetical protein
MELQIAFLVTGILVIGVAIYRTRRLSDYSYLRDRLQDTYAIEDIDLSGNTEYANCFAQEWVYDSLSTRKHGRMGKAFQSYLMNSTLIAAIWIGLFMGLISVIVGLLFIEGIQLFGMAIFVVAIGLGLAVGPGEPRISEDLLQAMLEVEYKKLCENDYPYVVVAVSSIRKWSAITFICGILFLVASPFAESIPVTIAWLLSFISDVLFWGPAIFLLEISVIIAIIYIAIIVPLVFIIIAKGASFLRKQISSEQTTFDDEMYEQF